jgi:hypothetical protein
MKRYSLMASIALSAAVMLGMGATAGVPSQKAIGQMQQPRGTTPREWFSGLGGRSGRPGHRAAYGWTTAHAQRVAAKKRNQARHRSAGRGRSRS